MSKTSPAQVRLSCGRRRFLALAGAGAVAFAGRAAVANEETPTTLFAAASTVDVMTAVAAAYAAAGHGSIRPVFAGSSTLAQQILHGAPADMYLSASTEWMDVLAARGAIEAGSRVVLFGNRLVLIAPAHSAFAIRIEHRFDLAAALGDNRLAMGEPSHVPAGTYARAALESLGVWRQVEPKAAFMTDVRAALALVARGEAAAGIVYATDAAISPKVRIVDTFPADSHPPITYPLALVAGRRTEASQAAYAFLRGTAAGNIYAAYGFIPSTGGA